MDLCIFWFSLTCFMGHPTRVAHISRKWNYCGRSAIGAQGQQMTHQSCVLAAIVFCHFGYSRTDFATGAAHRCPLGRLKGAFFFFRLLLYAHPFSFFSNFFVHLFFEALRLMRPLIIGLMIITPPPTILAPGRVPISSCAVFFLSSRVRTRTSPATAP